MIPEAADELVRMLEDDLDLPVSRDRQGAMGKSVAMASHAGLGRQLLLPLRRLGIRMEARTRNLGVDCYGAGARRGASVRTQRMRTFKARGPGDWPH